MPEQVECAESGSKAVASCVPHVSSNAAIACWSDAWIPVKTASAVASVSPPRAATLMTVVVVAVDPVISISADMPAWMWQK